MEHTDAITNEYDDWACEPARTEQHVDGIRTLLTTYSDEAARAASLRRRDPYLIDPIAGDLRGRRLCWICASALAHEGPRLPRFRACRWCLAHDRGKAQRLGLLHLLPVFEWPFAPVRDEATAAQLPASTRSAVGEAWSSVTQLDRWRRESVALSHAYMSADIDGPIDLYDWQQRLTVGSGRSRACWSAYVEGYFPRLAQAVQIGRAHV